MQVAGIQDFREAGPPADIGAFAFPAQVIVYQHTFGGVVYVVAARQGDRGWVLVDHRTLTGANATIVIQAANNALTVGRTSKEKVTVKGAYVDLAQITYPSYIEFELIGKLTALANLGVNFLIANQATEIEIHGGHVDANKENQNVDMGTIVLTSVTYAWIHHVRVRGGQSIIGVEGDGIKFSSCTDGIISDCDCYSADFDNIGLLSSSRIVIIGNQLRDPGENDVQLVLSCDSNIIADNSCYDDATSGQFGIAICQGNSSANVVIGNNVYTHSFGYGTNAINGGSEYNLFIGNFAYSCTRGFTIGGAVAEHSEFTFIIGNTLRNCGTGIRLELSDYAWVNGNYIIDCTVAIIIDAGSTGNRFGPQYIYNCATIVTDNGTGTQFPSLTMALAVYGAGATSETQGILINAATEYALASMIIPFEAHCLVKIVVSAVAVPAEADGMQLEVRTNAGGENEAFNTHASTAALTSTTLNFAANDIIRWTQTAAAVTAIKGGDDLNVRVVYSVAVGADIATNAWMRTVTIYYI